MFLESLHVYAQVSTLIMFYKGQSIRDMYYAWVTLLGHFSKETNLAKNNDVPFKK